MVNLAAKCADKRNKWSISAVAKGKMAKFA